MSKEILCSYCFNNTIKVWHISDKKCLKTICNPVSDLINGRDGVILKYVSESILFVRSRVNDIKLCNIRSGNLTKTFSGHTDSIYYILIYSK